MAIGADKHRAVLDFVGKSAGMLNACSDRAGAASCAGRDQLTPEIFFCPYPAIIDASLSDAEHTS